MTNVSIVAAVANHRVIGFRGAIPWRLPADMKRFQKLTIGHPVIMGRATYQSLPAKNRPLPDRINIVLSKTLAVFRGCLAAHSLPEALELAGDKQEIFIIGGANVYAETLTADLAERIYLTVIEEDFDGDAFFPQIDFRSWRVIEHQRYPAGADSAYSYSFLVYQRFRSERKDDDRKIC